MEDTIARIPVKDRKLENYDSIALLIVDNDTSKEYIKCTSEQLETCMLHYIDTDLCLSDEGITLVITFEDGSEINHLL